MVNQSDPVRLGVCSLKRQDAGVTVTHFKSYFSTPYFHFLRSILLRNSQLPISTTSLDHYHRSQEQSHDGNHDMDMTRKVLATPRRINTKSKHAAVVNSRLSHVVSTNTCYTAE